ncbi:MAG: short-chain dehydrogenase [Nitrospinae bacterium CG11_big_fil_rev_8_21_14_0_20_56_8]|nr:MAG: short-chain dehydrogenase [Nitrospinae bacterium CG11_big_fil_rev_8_21_14_0_20_56_8]
MPTAIVTGGALRLGRALALHLARGGWNIALHYNTSREPAEAVLAEVRALGGKAEAFACDFSALDQSEGLIENVLRVFPDVELLVNSASVFILENVEATRTETLVDSFQINLLTPFLLMREYKRRVNRGLIVNIVDERVLRNIPAFAAYSVTKVGLHHLTHLAALEWGSTIRVNAIAPGLILPPPWDSEEYLEKHKHQIPTRTHGSPGDIVRGLQYLIDSPFVNGETLFIDGGESKK